MHDDEIEGITLEGQRREPCHGHIDEDSGIRRRSLRARRITFFSHRNRRVAAQSDLRGNRACDRRIVNTDLQYALAHAHGAHRHGQRFDAGFAQKHVIFDMV